ncbi:hypothetical protein L1987_18786 [Smallanthus sonchifolius]|uniref:Uncharacterized protein n=1 Tax=Smallanthus sonchifolius TaxID=185202 RepID=A0ACB9J0J6_9ASTR|nr:hypothetical protein L1987_18786 [Smallanthus sonchifolius]
MLQQSSSTSSEDDAVRQIATEAEPQVNSKKKLSKVMEEEHFRKANPELLKQDELEAKAQADVEIAETPLVILSEDSTKAEGSKVISKDSTPKVQKSSEEILKETTLEIIHKSYLPNSTPRQKSITKRVWKNPLDVVLPSREKYKRLHETVDVKEFSDRYLERMTSFSMD